MSRNHPQLRSIWKPQLQYTGDQLIEMSCEWVGLELGKKRGRQSEADVMPILFLYFLKCPYPSVCLLNWAQMFISKIWVISWKMPLSRFWVIPLLEMSLSKDWVISFLKCPYLKFGLFPARQAPSLTSGLFLEMPLSKIWVISFLKCSTLDFGLFLEMPLSKIWVISFLKSPCLNSGLFPEMPLS